MKITITDKGAQDLRSLARNMDNAIENITAETAQFMRTINCLGDSLGIIQDDIFACCENIQRSVVAAEPPARVLTQKMRNTASKIEDYVNSSKISSDAAEKSGSANGGWQPDFRGEGSEAADLADPVQEYADLTAELEKNKVEYRPIKWYEGQRTGKDITERLGGDDNTAGSCSSLAFAYIGNLAGFDVLDLRGGKSRLWFSNNENIEKIANLPGVNSRILHDKNDIQAANELLASMEEGKEYYLATGKHAAMVRKCDDGYEFLELQHWYWKRWFPLGEDELKERFGCSNHLFRQENILIEADSLAASPEFLQLLGYLNTAEYERHEEVNGDV